MIKLICIERENALKICAPPPWIKTIEDKLSNIDSAIPMKIATKVPLIKKILLRLLNLKPIKYENSFAIIGYIGAAGAKDTLFLELTNKDWYKLYSHKLPDFIALPLSEISRVLIYTLVGALGILVNLGVAVSAQRALLNSLKTLANPIASTLGFESSVLSNFVLHELITFKGTDLEKTAVKILERLLKYHFASITSWATQVSTATILPILFGVAFWVAQFIGILLGFVVNFILGYLYTWSRHRLRT